MNRWETAALVISYINKLVYDEDEKKSLVSLVMNWAEEKE
ncbi:MAG: hypothetical protein BWY85_00448 [Firmicutes bacterium ADurb.Bin506]|nr:MAG: hypothetical protein BWY85_00448 [Firmicutes bacterium ADurb.Bin506]